MRFYNVCGMHERDFAADGRCYACRVCGCDNTPDILVPDRVYEYAMEHALLTSTEFFPKFVRNDIVVALRDKKHYRKTPKYFRDFLAYDGESFASLADFPIGVMFVVSRDSDNGEFQMGDIVWRSNPEKFGGADGINFKQIAVCLETDDCDAALKGAQFERVPFEPVPER